MRRRTFLNGLVSLSLLGLLPAWGRVGSETGEQPEAEDTSMPNDIEPLDKSREEWRRLLDEDAYDVLFREKTERAGSSPLNEEYRDGTFICAACFLPLFESETKFESGTGWPSFYDHIPGRIETKRDYKLIFPRTEYHCIRCKGHQGHVFNDGPEPTGKRWCNNGVALRFVPEGEPLPDLRT